MKKQFPFIQLDFENRSAPLYRQIYEAIRAAILSGELVAETRLPATRLLAENLGVSRLTVVNAYEQLFAEGYLESKRGAGTYVASKLPEDLLTTAKAKANKTEAKQNAPLNLSPFGEKLISRETEEMRLATAVKFQPFQNGLTAIDEFPFDVWSRIAQKYHRNPPRKMLSYGDSQGYAPLREAIATHLKSARGVNCTAEQIVITSGAQQAIDLTARIFLSAKDSFIIEEPCYLEARNSFAATGAKLIAAAVDEDGLDAEKIPKSGDNAKLVYVTPSRQYPLGYTMSLPRRLALLDWANRKNAWIIEDDYDSEFRYSGRPLASLQGLSESNRVIYVGTFSKSIFPSLRIGCAVVPTELVGVFSNARALSHVHSPVVEQAILADFIREGHFARHVRRMRMLYEARRDALLEACEKHLKGLLEVERADAGMHLVGWLSKGTNAAEISRRAAEQNLKLKLISTYYIKKSLSRDGFVLGYTAFDEKQIRHAVKKLKTVLTAEIER